MNIRNIFRKEQSYQDTPYGRFNLAKADERKRLQVQMQMTTDALIRRDIRDWRKAWQLAINVDSPQRLELYDIYRDVEVDLHLSGCVEQRKGFVRSRSFKLVDIATGKEREELLNIFDATWFKQLLEHILDSHYYGHSLVELGDVVTTDNGIMAYDGVELISRKHVVPEYHRVVVNANDDYHSGIDYHEAPWCDNVIEAGNPYDLGIYLKAATQTIPKKNVMAFWDTFSEIFGMPLRIAHTTSRDDAERQKVEKMLDNMGTEFWALLPEGTDIDVTESSRGDAYNVYDKRIDRANSELSKLIIGQTMTIEDGSSLSQSETHLKVFNNLVESDCDRVRDVINGQLLPRMLRHGFPLKGIRFDWDYSVDYKPSEQLAYETMIADRYDVDPNYFADKYGMPVGERRNPTAPTSSESSESSKSLSAADNGFFA